MSRFSRIFLSKLIFPRERGADGFIIVAVLWILAALATLAGVYSVYVSNTAIAAHVGDDRLRVEALVSAGVELTAYRLVAFEESKRPTSGAFAFRLGRSDVAVEFRSEGARIDLNAAPKELLAGLFTTLGAKPENAQYFADRIIGWRTKSEAAGQNKEADAYREARLSYPPRQAPFQNVAELRLVLGLPPNLVESALPFVTVFNGRAEIDVIEAAPEVVASLPKINPSIVGEILARRHVQTPEAVMALLGAARSSVAIEGRKATRASVRVALDNGRRVNADVVLLILEEGQEPYRILSWRDDFDGPV
ncbi:type II secretion system protein GspK [Methylocapsa polymorpha]|uniref:Type II secretion system protein GspK n=1 Tax=Methylocapsa polymorpha TaxID=3080828 RepID=A0ABZ0HW92_9HYPH|nr:type II secretion system protein GspK [Methylocapsa sp. RX1]